MASTAILMSAAFLRDGTHALRDLDQLDVVAGQHPAVVIEPSTNRHRPGGRRPGPARRGRRRWARKSNSIPFRASRAPIARFS